MLSLAFGSGVLSLTEETWCWIGWPTLLLDRFDYPFDSQFLHSLPLFFFERCPCLDHLCLHVDLAMSAYLSISVASLAFPLLILAQGRTFVLCRLSACRSPSAADYFPA